MVKLVLAECVMAVSGSLVTAEPPAGPVMLCVTLLLVSRCVVVPAGPLSLVGLTLYCKLMLIACPSLMVPVTL